MNFWPQRLVIGPIATGSGCTEERHVRSSAHRSASKHAAAERGAAEPGARLRRRLPAGALPGSQTQPRHQPPRFAAGRVPPLPHRRTLILVIPMYDSKALFRCTGSQAAIVYHPCHTEKQHKPKTSKKLQTPAAHPRTFGNQLDAASLLKPQLDCSI